MKKNYIITSFLLISMIFSAFAQESKSSLKIHAGLSLPFPMSDFADGDVSSDDRDLAGKGINIGVEYVYQFNESGLGLFIGLDMYRNGLNSDYINDIEDSIDESVDVKFPVYYNIPISLGLIFNYKASETKSFYCKTGVVYNSLKVSEYKYESESFDANTKYDLATNFGIKIGGGITYKNKWSIGVDYLNIGINTVDSETTIKHEAVDPETGSDYFKDSRELNVDILSVTLGYKF